MEPIYDAMHSACEVLERLGITHAVTGSLASSVYGIPVSSLDVDVCLRMTTGQVAELFRRIPTRFYCNEQALLEAVQNHSMVNLIDTATQFKVDLSVVPAEPFYHSVLARRRKVSFGIEGPIEWTVSPEDIILMKLLWRKDTRSQKQWENALSVAKVWGARLDWKYLRIWGETLFLIADLERFMAEAGI
jgi:hypothetical protein